MSHGHTRSRQKRRARGWYYTVQQCRCVEVYFEKKNPGGPRTRRDAKNYVIYVLSVWHQKIVCYTYVCVCVCARMCDTVRGVRVHVIYVINNFNGHPSGYWRTAAAALIGRGGGGGGPVENILSDWFMSFATTTGREKKLYIYYSHTHTHTQARVYNIINKRLLPPPPPSPVRLLSVRRRRKLLQ